MPWFLIYVKWIYAISGEQIKDFVKELSYRICWVSDDEDLKLSAVLIGALVSLKLISKAYVWNRAKLDLELLVAFYTMIC